MFPTALIDLHCDTLADYNYAKTGNPDTLDDPQRVLSLSAIPEGVNWAQFYAVFVPNEEQGQAAVEYFEKNRANFERQMELFSDRVAPCRGAADMEAAWAAGKTAAFLTIENGTPINGDLARVKELADQGVCCITLVWNGDYEIGSGHTTEKGLTDFGKALIPELEKHGILIDVSHLNDNGFADLLKVAKKPFIATHSNSHALYPHTRNLRDRHFAAIKELGGIVGVSLCPAHLTDCSLHPATAEDVFAHVDYYLSLGGEDVVGFGADWDGTDLPEGFSGVGDLTQVAEIMAKHNYSDDLIHKIYWKNFYDFALRNL